MNKVVIKSFPAHQLDAARKALAQAHARLERAAARSGQDAPAAPSLVVIAERVVSICSVCRCEVDGHLTWCPDCPAGLVRLRRIVDLELVAPRPVLAGWDFLAVVEPLDGGNLLRQVPGATVAEGELSPWREGAIACDHCRAARRRAETFIVRADGSDSAVAAGTYKQVGRQCLSAFLGGMSAAAIVASLGWPDMIRAIGEGDGSGGGGAGTEVFVPDEFMSWVASAIRISGWLSRSASREQPDGPRATADLVQYLLTPQYSAFGAEQQKQREARELYAPSDEDRARGSAALAWARDLSDHGSDYERNLRLIARQDALDPKHAGILASAVQAHARAIGDMVRRTQAGLGHSPSQHVGAVGDKKHDFGGVVIERIVAIQTPQYGALHIHAMRDAAGNALVWKTAVAHGMPGDHRFLIGNIKAHTEYRGEQQTVLTRCKLTTATAKAVLAAPGRKRRVHHETTKATSGGAPQ